MIGPAESSTVIPKTLAALNVLANTKTAAKELLNGIKANEADHIEIRKLIAQIREDIGDAEKRSLTETIRIGILGGRGSGKSTLANALMGDEFLPESAIIFCTNLPTMIRYSPSYWLDVKSELEEYSYSEKNISKDQMKKILNRICKESENPDNAKKISSINIGIPQKILDGKEIVDVPGFTRGNPLHQAFAERYAKHYCDVCLVMLNNSESIEVGNHQGLEALAKIFAERLESTVFIINKRDECSENDIKYVKNIFRRHLAGHEPLIYEISSKNSLKKNGDQYDFQNLLGHLSYLSTRRTLVLVRALLERMISNFTSFKDLCRLTADELESLLKDISSLLKNDFDHYKKSLDTNLKRHRIVSGGVPQVDVSILDLPQNPLGLSPYEYADQLVNEIRSQTGKLDELVQHQQASIYRSFNVHFEEEIAIFSRKLQEKVRGFEAKFGITSSIEAPKMGNGFKIPSFDPSGIERLKPPPLRLWLEKKLPKILVRDIKFWKKPFSINLGYIGVDLGIPIGVKSTRDMVYEIQENIPAEAVTVMNEYVFAALNDFVSQLDQAYSGAIEQFEKAWEHRLHDYADRIQIAKSITSEEIVSKVDDFIGELRRLHANISILMAEA
ncbi:MAG: dynamin family protein [Acidobacteriota bacterium]